MTKSSETTTTVRINPNPTKESNAMRDSTSTTTDQTKRAGARSTGRKKPAKETAEKTAKPAKEPKPQPTRAGGLPLMIGLDKLCRDPANVRPGAGDVGELAASIAAHGVIQPLTVRPEVKVDKQGKDRPTGRYLVVAGGRRLRALLKLAGDRRLPKDADVPCVVRPGGTERDAAEVSLAENVERLPMNAADEHAAFAKLADAGMSSADIAARFGIGRRRVEQRLALGRIAPDLLDELRKGAMSAGAAQALTLTANHERQRDVWRQCRGGWNAEAQARRLLTGAAMSLDDPLMRFVGRDAYGRAGGTVRVDLFSEREDGEGFAEDAALVRRLAAERLDAEAEKVRAGGWAFVLHELQEDVDPHGHRREQPARRERTRDEQHRADEIGAELLRLEEEGRDGRTPEGRMAQERWDHLGAELELMEARREEWTPEQKRRCGVFLSVNDGGRVEQRRGLVDPAWDAEQRRKAEERRAAVPAGGSAVTADSDGGGAADPVEMSRALVWRLTKARTEALRAAMVREPGAAADLLLAHLCERLFFRTQFAGRGPLPFEANVDPGRDDWCPGTGKATPERGSHGTDQPSEAQAAFYEGVQAWRSRLPQTPDALPAFVAGLGAAEKLALLGLLAAASLNAVTEAAGGGYGPKSDESVARVAQHVGCDVRAWWVPTAAGVFDHMTKAGIAAAVAEALPKEPGKANAVAGMKKADAARKAEQFVAGADWLPPPLRPAHRPRESAGPIKLPTDAPATAPAKQAA